MVMVEVQESGGQEAQQQMAAFLVRHVLVRH
jgi:hypothetical protein